MIKPGPARIAGILIAICMGWAGTRGPALASEPVIFFNHVHTHYSRDNDWAQDQKQSPAELYRRALEYSRNLGVTGAITFTDHNRDFSKDELQGVEEPRVLIVRGMEWGGNTHLNLLGLDPDWKGYQINPIPTHKKQLKAAEGSGLLRVINHPRILYAQWEPKQWGDADAVEIWNAPMGSFPFNWFPGLPRNKIARRDWAQRLYNQYFATAVAGSDYHFDIKCFESHLLFYPANLVWSPSNQLNDLSQTIKEGDVSIIMRPESPWMEFEANWRGATTRFRPGQKIKGDGILDLTIRLDVRPRAELPLEKRCYREYMSRAWKWIRPAVQKVAIFDSQNSRRPIWARTIKKRPLPGVYEYQVPLKVRAGRGPRSIWAEIYLVGHLGPRREPVSMTNPLRINWTRTD